MRANKPETCGVPPDLFCVAVAQEVHRASATLHTYVHLGRCGCVPGNVWDSMSEYTSDPELKRVRCCFWRNQTPISVCLRCHCASRPSTTKNIVPHSGTARSFKPVVVSCPTPARSPIRWFNGAQMVEKKLLSSLARNGPIRLSWLDWVCNASTSEMWIHTKLPKVGYNDIFRLIQWPPFWQCCM